MTMLYKLTDANDQTYHGCQWGDGITHEADGQGELCTVHWIHATTHPLLAVLLNPIQGNYDLTTAHLWEGEGEIGATDHGLKVGCTRFTTIRRIDVPAITQTQRIAFGILCALEVNSSPGFIKWASAWLDSSDRSAEMAEMAARAAAEMGAWEAAEMAAMVAMAARAVAAAMVAWEVAEMAEMAARAAAEMGAMAAAEMGARAAAKMGAMAARAARAAAEMVAKIDLVALAEKAMEYK